MEQNTEEKVETIHYLDQSTWHKQINFTALCGHGCWSSKNSEDVNKVTCVPCKEVLKQKGLLGV